MAFKGTSIIELTDVNTGEVEVHKDENMVTNALSTVLTEFMKGIIYELFNQGGIGVGGNNRLDDTTKFGLIPLFNRGIGGIFLFEAPQTEDVNNIYPKGNAVLTGYASNHVNGVLTDKKLGSMDLANSGPVENGYKFVWDFTTEQANGIISCLALTTAAAGRVGLGMYYTLGTDKTAICNDAPENLSGTFIPVSKFELSTIYNPLSNTSKTQEMYTKLASIVKIDPSTMIAISCQRISADTICIEKLKLWDNVIDPYTINDPATIKILDRFEITFTESLSDFTSNSCCFCEDASDANIIWFFYSRDSSTNTFIRWAKINISEKTMTTGLAELPMSITWTIGATYYYNNKKNYPYNAGYDYGYYYFENKSYCIVWHNKLFWYDRSYGTTIKKFSLTDFTLEATYTSSMSMPSTSEESSNWCPFVYIKSSDILYTPFGYFDSDEVFHPTYWGAGNLEKSTSNSFLTSLGRKFEYNGIIYSLVYTHSSSFSSSAITGSLRKYLYTPMLHTINNLSSAVQKTVAKTMKITYVLTEVDK